MNVTSYESRNESPLILSKGDKVTFQDGTSVIVSSDELLGHGGQGNIYRVKDSDNREYALKWIVNESFFAKSNEQFYNNIAKLSNTDNSKGKLSNFAYPLKVTELRQNGQFGYLMDIIPKKMVPLEKIISGSNGFRLIDVELKACLNLAESFSNLHFYRYIFSDINLGSFFFDLDTGDVKICDCDNIVSESDPSHPIGTMGFMAPEVFRNKKCTKHTDYFSLAVIFYRILLHDDPFEGSKYKGIISEEKKKQMYIDNPIFTMSPSDDSNRPAQNVIDAWGKLPENIRSYFEDTFTDGISNVKLRKDAHAWTGIFKTWIDDIHTYAFNMFDVPEIPVKTQIVMFIIDVSGSMEGTKINGVNNAIRECVKELRECEKENKQIRFEVSILMFGDSCRWYNEQYVRSVSSFKFSNIDPADSMTNFDEVCMTLDKVLTEDVLVDPDRKYKRPCILLISDGGCPERYYAPYLKELRANKVFRDCLVYALGANDDKGQASMKMLTDFTGDEDSVLSVDVFKEKLGELIYNLTMTVSISNTADQDKLKMKNMVKNMGLFEKYSGN